MGALRRQLHAEPTRRARTDAEATPTRCTWLVAAVIAVITTAGCDSCNETSPTSVAPNTAATTTWKIAPPMNVPRRCNNRCRISGGCHWDGRRCVATSDAHCRQAHACRVNGMCTNQGGLCRGTSDEDCKQATRCADEGLCHYRGRGATNCYAKTDDDCAKSKHCEQMGKCNLDRGYCVRPGH